MRPLEGPARRRPPAAVKIAFSPIAYTCGRDLSDTLDMHAVVRLNREELVQRWRALGADPQAPEFYELDEFGELVVSPAPTNQHELVAVEVAKALERELGPRSSAAVSVLTDCGVLRPDATWMPLERWSQCARLDPLPFAPDICVEVLSPSNTRAEMQKKVGAYLGAGAREVILVDLNGRKAFFGAEGERVASAFGLQLVLPADLF